MMPRKSQASAGRTAYVCLLGLLCVLSANTYAQSSSDEEAINSLLKTHTEKWNVHDMDAWAEILHDDADWANWRGVVWRGKEQIREEHGKIHRTYYKATRMSAQRIEDLTFLTPEIALAHVRSEMSGDERSPGQTFQYRKTFVFTKKNGAWRVRALHNTRIL
jgi:uncharacterized protein (TIGR02246 family)